MSDDISDGTERGPFDATDPQITLPRPKQKGTAAVVISFLSLFISLVSLGFTGLTYWNQWVGHLSLIVDPSVSTTIDSSFHFATTVDASNIGNQTIEVGDFDLVGLIGTLSQPPKCSDQSVLRQVEDQTRNPSSNPQENSYLVPIDIKNEAGASHTHAFAVSSNQVLTISFEFDASQLPWEGGNKVVTLCPIFTYIDPSGTTSYSICDGWEISVVFTNGRLIPRIINGKIKAETLLPQVDKACAYLKT
jgi:hypothetical protein